MVLCLRECLGAMASFTTESTQTGLSEGADRIGGQLRGGKIECHCSGRAWSKVPESDAGSVALWQWSEEGCCRPVSAWPEFVALITGCHRPAFASQVGRKITRGLQ